MYDGAYSLVSGHSPCQSITHPFQPPPLPSPLESSFNLLITGKMGWGCQKFGHNCIEMGTQGQRSYPLPSWFLTLPNETFVGGSEQTQFVFQHQFELLPKPSLELCLLCRQVLLLATSPSLASSGPMFMLTVKQSLVQWGGSCFSSSQGLHAVFLGQGKDASRLAFGKGLGGWNYKWVRND